MRVTSRNAPFVSRIVTSNCWRASGPRSFNVSDPPASARAWRDNDAGCIGTTAFVSFAASAGIVERQSALTTSKVAVSAVSKCGFKFMLMSVDR